MHTWISLRRKHTLTTLRMAVLAALLAPAAGQSTQQSMPIDHVAAPLTIDSARELAMRGQESQAIEILQTLTAQHPPAAGAWRELGIVFYRIGKLMDADNSFAAATAEDPSDLAAVQMRGLTLYRMGRAGEALPLLERTRGVAGTADMDTNYVLGRCFIDAQRFDDARAAFAAQYGLDPQSAQAYTLTAQLLLTLELSDPAVEAAQKAIALAPQMPMAHFVLGKILLAKGSYANALKEFELERAVNPTNAALYQFLGDLYLRMGDKNKAQTALTQALSLDTSSTGPFVLMGRLFLDKNDPQTAAGYLEHAEQMDPSNYITHYMLGQAYRKLGRRDDAKRELDIVSTLHANEIKPQQ